MDPNAQNPIWDLKGAKRITSRRFVLLFKASLGQAYLRFSFYSFIHKRGTHLRSVDQVSHKLLVNRHCAPHDLGNMFGHSFQKYFFLSSTLVFFRTFFFALLSFFPFPLHFCLAFLFLLLPGFATIYLMSTQERFTASMSRLINHPLNQTQTYMIAIMQRCRLCVAWWRRYAAGKRQSAAIEAGRPISAAPASAIRNSVMVN